MAQEIREFAVLVPAGTAKATPLVTNIAFPARIVTAISYRVPPGPSGHLGWALTSAGTPVIPIQQNTFIVVDDHADTWFLEGYLDSGNWQVTAFNTGIYPHTVFFTFQLDLPGTAVAPPPSPSGQGVGVIGSTGTVTPPPNPPPSSGSSPPPTRDDSAAVATAVMAVLLGRLRTPTS